MLQGIVLYGPVVWQIRGLLQKWRKRIMTYRTRSSLSDVRAISLFAV